MVPFTQFSQIDWQGAPPMLERFMGYPAINLEADAAAGFSSGQGMQAIQTLVDQMPEVGLEWSGLSYQEQQSSNQAIWLYLVSVAFIFLCLAALYESWSIPFSVLMVIPLGIVGAVGLTYLGMVLLNDPNLSNNIYFQVAIIAVIGLAAKNAILIVEFAKELQEDHGEPLLEATLHAAKMRLRPIIMTTLAFGFGVLPLALSSGAGAGSQHSVGYGVLGGVISSTLLGIFFIPVFYVWIRSIFKYKPKKPNNQEQIS